MNINNANTLALNTRQLAAIRKIGLTLVAKDDGIPSFSESGVICFVAESIEGFNSKDKQDLLILLNVLGYFPQRLIDIIIFIADRGFYWRGPGGSSLRKLDFALKALIRIPYYSQYDKNHGYEIFNKNSLMLATIGWKTTRLTSNP